MIVGSHDFLEETAVPEPGPVTTTRIDDVAVVTFDDGKANALSFTTIDLLQEAIGDAAASSKAVVLAGRPGFFSAGLDLRVVKEADPSVLDELIDRLRVTLDATSALPVPVVAAVTGHALAGGALWLLASDYRVGPAIESVRIGLTEVAVGIPMPAFAQHYATVRLDKRVLLRATVLAETVSPDVATQWGYLDEVVDQNDVVTRAVEKANTFAALDPAAFIATKRQVFAG